MVLSFKTEPKKAPWKDIPKPARIAKLPRNEHGYPIPWFVSWWDGKPMMALMDRQKWKRAACHRLCWVCGEPLGKYMHFVISPIGAIKAVTADPASHGDCVEYAMKVCPFLLQSQTNDQVPGFYEDEEVTGNHDPRNPGIMVDWACWDYRIFDAPQGGQMIRLGVPTKRPVFWTEGRHATEIEAHYAIDDAYQRLVAIDREKGRPDGIEELTRLTVLAKERCFGGHVGAVG